ncbi:hypothetical protein GGR51DRAFT_250819 [Nemania sp. FL0031]|nr:hypothetical protein GGR51DRAFT_250819 [Nemania sp. FL0031]
METVMVSCSKCSSQKGTFPNRWTRIGKSFISPIDPAGLKDCSEGPLQKSSRAGIWVRRIICNQCRSTLGCKCVSSGDDFVNEGQLLLYTSDIQIKDPSGSSIVEPAIERTTIENNPPTIKSQPKENDHRSRLRDGQATTQNQAPSPILNNIGTQTGAISRPNTAGDRTVTSFNEDTGRIDNEGRRLRNDVAQMTNGPSDTNSKIRSLADDVLSVKAEIKETRREMQQLVTQDHLEQESTSIRVIIDEVDTSLRAKYSGNWEEHQQRLNLLESQVKNTQRDLKKFQTLLESARTTAESAQAASDANTEEIIGLKGRVQRMDREIIVQGGLITRPQRREPQASQIVGLKRKAAPDDYTEGTINSGISSSAARNIGDNLLPSPSATALRNAASADTPKLTKSRAVDKRIPVEVSPEPASDRASKPTTTTRDINKQ